MQGGRRPPCFVKREKHMFRCVLLREAEKSDRCRFGNEGTHIFCRPDSFRERPFRHRHTVRVKNRAAAEERLRPNSPALRLTSRRRGGKGSLHGVLQEPGAGQIAYQPRKQPHKRLAAKIFTGPEGKKTQALQSDGQSPEGQDPRTQGQLPAKGKAGAGHGSTATSSFQ